MGPTWPQNHCWTCEPLHRTNEQCETSHCTKKQCETSLLRASLRTGFILQVNLIFLVVRATVENPLGRLEYLTPQESASGFSPRKPLTAKLWRLGTLGIVAFVLPWKNPSGALTFPI